MFSKKRGNFRNNSNNRNRYSRPHHNKSYQKKVYRHCEQLKETEVGITEYISEHVGFGGIIKARFSDFQVHEINLQGEVAKLTDTSIPKEFSMKMVKTDFKAVPLSPNENIPQEKWEAIKNVALTPDSEPVVLEIDNVSKEMRKEIHECIKSHFGKKVISSTVQEDGKQFIKITKYNKDVKTDTRVQWPVDFGEYVYFILYKEKVDTMEACMKLSSAFRMSSSKFTHAGTKDRRSITSQWFCVHKVEPWKLLQKARNIYNIRVGNFMFKDEPLRLGQLQGNHFKIALRNVTGTDEDICRFVNDLKESGFINYFGLQRFGNDKEAPTFQIGIKLLQGKWKEAVQLILKPKASDDQMSSQGDVAKAKQIYSETGNAAKAYEIAHKNKTSSMEFKLLEGLSKNNENDYVNALENVPRSMRLLYLHSFQSLIWNKMVSKRLKLFGMKPVEGDLVYTDQPTDKQEETVIPQTTEKSDDDKHDAEMEMDSTKVDEDTQSEELEAEADKHFKCKKSVKVLTSADLSDYTIFDVVLPLPGYDVVYPESLKQHYKEALEEHELTLEMTKQKVRSYNLCGDYRKIMEKVDDLSCKTIQYNNPTDDLIRSDLQELKGDPEPVSVEGGKYKALILDFSLSPCSYATMLLREIMKCETSSFAQSQRNNYDEDKTEKKQKKILINSTDDSIEDDTEGIEMLPSNSLLSNPDKYEEFKNSIFNSVGESLKRTITDSVVEEKNKKLKKDDKGEKIMQASLI